MTYKHFRKIQLYILISLIYFIFSKNFQLIFKTRNITEADHNLFERVILVEKSPKNEDKPNTNRQKGLFTPSLEVKQLANNQYIKGKQSKSISSPQGPIDKAIFGVKRLIGSLYHLLSYLVLSVKDRLQHSQVSLRQQRNLFLKSLEGSFDSRSAPLAKGLLFGDVSGISQDIYHSFKVIGILHILSASSANFTIFLQFGLLLWRPALPFLTKNQLFLLHFALIGAYFTLVGAAPSTIRAFVGLTLGFYAAFVLQRSYSPVFNLYLIGILIVLINPLYLRALGFQFSFLASWGILLLYSFLEKEPWIGQNYLFKSLLLTFCAQFFLLPFMIYNFGEINYLAFLANLVILPLVELLTVLYLASFMAFILSGALTTVIWQQLLSTLISNLLDILFTLINFLEQIPWKTVTFNENKDLFSIVFILINCGGIIALNTLKGKRYSKNQYRIFK